VLDTTIAVVALRYIAGGLSATVNDGEWVITSYLAANAIILPLSGWLAVRFGHRNYFLFSTSCSRSLSSRSLLRCVEWPRVSTSLSCSA
jgi:MFS family permease